MARSFLLRKNKPTKGRFGLCRKGFYRKFVDVVWQDNANGQVRKFFNDWLEAVKDTQPTLPNLVYDPVSESFITAPI